jgi:hypothetical protein
MRLSSVGRGKGAELELRPLDKPQILVVLQPVKGRRRKLILSDKEKY